MSCCANQIIPGIRYSRRPTSDWPHELWSIRSFSLYCEGMSGDGHPRALDTHATPVDSLDDILAPDS